MSEWVRACNNGDVWQSTLRGKVGHVVARSEDFLALYDGRIVGAYSTREDAQGAVERFSAAVRIARSVGQEIT